MPAVIARIRLANGELGYIDDLSGIYLNWTQPEKDVYEGTNCTNLRRGVKARRIILLAGSLGRPRTFNELLHKVTPPEPKPIYEIDRNGKRKEYKEAPIKIEKPIQKPEPEPIVDEPEIVVEEPQEAPAVEQPIVEEISEAVDETSIVKEVSEETAVEDQEDKPKKKKSKKKS